MDDYDSYDQGYIEGYDDAIAVVPVIVTEMVLYGMNFLLSTATTTVLLRQSKGEGLVHRWLLLMLMLMFSFATADVTMNAISTLRAVRLTYVNMASVMRHSEIRQFLLLIQAALGDSVTIWRCYIVYGKSAIVVMLSVLTALASFAFGLYLASTGMHATTEPYRLGALLLDEKNFIWSAKSWIWAAITIVCTVYCTIAISSKIYSSARLIKGNKLFTVIFFVIETSLIYTLGITTYLGTLLMGAVVQLPPIVLCLLLLQIKFYNSGNQAVREINPEPAGPWDALRRFFRTRRKNGDMPTFQVAPGPVAAHDLTDTMPAESQHSDVDDTPSVSDSESDTIGKQEKEVSSVLDIA
ncbi:hypothetical protein EVG20_g7597 [Dentipellis fragilis]|uniref:Uncharacterized protein n=1 Tax=Dentipellis fragilis TaxID=205917 RepID=A0A4Y9YCA2_9AGAM|nr:hypothetical protein EVG20_g7597 [Dentipellis fragilis]